MKELTFSELLAEFERPTREKILEAIEKHGATHVVLAVCEDMWSSNLGKQTAMMVGPNNTYKTIEECEGQWIGDLPSQRQHFTKYAKVER